MLTEHLEVVADIDKIHKRPTRKGEDIRIALISKINPKGESYKQNFYNANAQLFLISNIFDILEFALEKN